MPSPFNETGSSACLCLCGDPFMSATQENQTYDPRAVEARAQQHWNDKDAYRVTESKDKKAFYACSMLPYPRASCIWATCATTRSTTC